MTARAERGFIAAVHLQAVLFDYGGTLDGPASHWLDRFAELYAEAGVEVGFDALKVAFYRADEAAYADSSIRAASLRELMDFHVHCQLHALNLADAGLHARLVDRFVDRSTTALAASRAVLDALADRFRLGVVSNFYGNVDRVLADAGIAPLLGVIADSTRLGMSKPDARIFAHAVGALGIEPAAALHVGDSYERDVRAARRAGLRAAWLVADCGARATEADLRLRSLDELPALLDGDSSQVSW